jgi:hypothetical protein
MADTTADLPHAPAPARGTVRVWEDDAVRRRGWMAALRAAGHAVRGASREAERAKALADGAVQVVVTSGGDGGPAPDGPPLVRLAPACPLEDVVAQVAAALVLPRPGGAATGRP